MTGRCPSDNTHQSLHIKSRHNRDPWPNTKIRFCKLVTANWEHARHALLWPLPPTLIQGELLPASRRTCINPLTISWQKRWRLSLSKGMCDWRGVWRLIAPNCRLFIMAIAPYRSHPQTMAVWAPGSRLFGVKTDLLCCDEAPSLADRLPVSDPGHSGNESLQRVSRRFCFSLAC